MTTYTVASGDTMWGIAAKHGIGLNQLIAANPQITNPSFIRIGQTINIPSASSSKTYTVVPGDSLWGIAAKYGIGLGELLSANPQIKNSAYILPGQTIQLPSGTSTPSNPSTPSNSNTPSDIAAQEAEVIRLVNIERQKAGRPALTENKKITQLAELKSQDFINKNYFSHTSPTYGSPFDMLSSNGISYTAAAENIAAGQRNAAEAVNSWMNSGGHRENILNAAYNQTGVGVARDRNGKLYWTQMFIRS